MSSIDESTPAKGNFCPVSNWDDWLLKDAWALEDAIHLILNQKPEDNNGWNNGEIGFDIFCKARIAIAAGTLRRIPGVTKNRWHQKDEDGFVSYVPAVDFVAWVRPRFGQHVSQEFREAWEGHCERLGLEVHERPRRSRDVKTQIQIVAQLIWDLDRRANRQPRTVLDMAHTVAIRLLTERAYWGTQSDRVSQERLKEWLGEVYQPDENAKKGRKREKPRLPNPFQVVKWDPLEIKKYVM